MAKAFVFLLLILAVVATVIMVFASSDFWVNLAVILALWAAFIGALLVSRYSGALGKEEARSKEQDARYRAELDAQRAEYLRREAELETSFATRGEGDREETLRLIRAELAGMREQLAELSGVDLTEEQVAVRARAERIIELERRSAGSGSASGTTTETTHDASTGSVSPFDTGRPTTLAPSGQSAPSSTPVQPRQGGRVGGFATGAFSAVNWTGADSQDTTMIPMVVDTRDSAPAAPESADRTSAVSPARSSAPAQPEAEGNRTEASSERRHGNHEAAQQSPWLSRDSAEGNPAAAAPEAGRQHHRRRSEDEVVADPHGRRRADERTPDKGSVTVAELMAQLKKNAR